MEDEWLNLACWSTGWDPKSGNITMKSNGRKVSHFSTPDSKIEVVLLCSPNSQKYGFVCELSLSTYFMNSRSFLIFIFTVYFFLSFSFGHRIRGLSYGGFHLNIDNILGKKRLYWLFSWFNLFCIWIFVSFLLVRLVFLGGFPFALESIWYFHFAICLTPLNASDFHVCFRLAKKSVGWLSPTL